MRGAPGAIERPIGTIGVAPDRRRQEIVEKKRNTVHAQQVAERVVDAMQLERFAPFDGAHGVLDPQQYEGDKDEQRVHVEDARDKTGPVDVPDEDADQRGADQDFAESQQHLADRYPASVDNPSATGDGGELLGQHLHVFSVELEHDSAVQLVHGCNRQANVVQRIFPKDVQLERVHFDVRKTA